MSKYNKVYLDVQTQTSLWIEPPCGSWQPVAPGYLYACWSDTEHLWKQRQSHSVTTINLDFCLLYISTIRLNYLAGGPPVGYRCRPSIRWQCRTQTWAWAQTASQSAAILPLPLASETHRRRAAGRAGSRRTGSDSIPAEQMERWNYAEGFGKVAWNLKRELKYELHLNQPN